MLKQLLEKKIADQTIELMQARSLIRELIGALDCKNEEIRQLIKDVALEYIKDKND